MPSGLCSAPRPVRGRGPAARLRPAPLTLSLDGAGGSGCRAAGRRRRRLRRPRLRRRRLGRLAGAVALAAARLRRPRRTPTCATRSRSTRRTCPDENPTGDHRSRVRPARRLAARADACCASTASTPAPGSGSTGTELGRATGQPAADRVRRRAACCARGRERARRPGAPVVGRQLPGGPGHVVAVRHLPRRSRCWPGPAGAVDDFFVHAGYDHRTGAGTLRVDADAPAPGSPCPELGLIDVAAGRDDRSVPASSRGRPSRRGCTTATLATGGERVAAADRLPHRGRRRTACSRSTAAAILFRGVNRHEFHPDHGRAVPEEVMLRRRAADEAAQHQRRPDQPLPAAPARSSTCATSYGLWVVDECDLETHGFGESAGAATRPTTRAGATPCVDRMRRMVERDKNHPSVDHVVARQREPASGGNLAAMAAWARDARPVAAAPLRGRLVERRTSTSTAGCTPPTPRSTRIGRGEEPPLHDPELRRPAPGHAVHPVRVRPRHGQRPRRALRVPGPVRAATRGCQGGFVWEWIDHGMRAPHRRRREYFAYGGDFGEPLHDGQLRLRRPAVPRPHPVPGPGRVQEGDRAGPHHRRPGRRPPVANLHDFLDLSHLAFEWSLEDGRRSRSPRAELDVPAVGPGRVRHRPPARLPPTDGRDLADRPGGPRRRPPLGPGRPRGRLGPGPRRPAAPRARTTAHREPRPRGPARGRVTGPGEAAGPGCPQPPDGGGGAFDAATGLLVGIGDLAVAGPRLDLWRAPTDNDRGAPRGGAGTAVAPGRAAPAAAPGRRGRGRGRRPGRPDPGGAGGHRPGRGRHLPVDGRRRRAAARGRDRSRGGVALPAAPARAADGRAGRAPAGSSGSAAGPARPTPTPAGRPGSAGSRPPWRSCRPPTCSRRRTATARDVRWATLTEGGGRGLRVEGEPTIDLTARRWTSEQLDAGPAPHRPRPRRPRLGQPRPGPARHRLGLLRPRCPPRLPPRPRAGQLRGAAASPALTWPDRGKVPGMAWTSWRSRLRRLPAPVVDAGLAVALAVAVTVAISVLPEPGRSARRRSPTGWGC